MATERQAPDVLLTQVNLSGAVGDIDEDVASPDGDWLTAIDDKTASIMAVSFPAPTGDPNTGAGLQNFKMHIRVTANGGSINFDVYLRENGTRINGGSPVGSFSSTSTGGETQTITWDASLLGTADGSLVECEVECDFVGGGPGSRTAGEFGAVEWNVDYTASSIDVTPTSVASVAALGAPTLDMGSISATPDSVATEALVGEPVAALNLAIDPGSVPSLAAVSEGGGAVVDYYFDASVSGPTDPDSVWTNDAKAFDGATGQVATASGVGDKDNNELRASGYSGPSSGGAISQVRVRIFGGVYLDGNPNNTIHAEILDSGTSLGEALNTVDYLTPDWGSYAVIDAPAGGWTWAKLDSIECVLFGTIDGSGYHKIVGKIELEVATGGGIEITFSVSTKTITATSLDTAALVGAPTINLGTLVVTATTLAGVAAVGTPEVAFVVLVTATSVGSVAALGTPGLALTLTVAPGGVGSFAIVTAPALALLLSVTPTTLATVALVADPTISFALAVTPDSVGTAAQVADPGLALALTIAVDSLATAAAIGEPTLSLAAIVVTAGSLASVALVNTPAISFALTVTPTALAGVAQVAAPTLDMGTLTVTATSLATAAQVTEPTLTFAIQITAASVTALALVGTPVVALQTVVITATTLASVAAISDPTISIGAIYVTANSVTSVAAITAPSLALTLTVTPLPATGPAVVSSPEMTLALTVDPTGLGSVAAVTEPALGFALVVTVTSLGSAASIGEPVISLAAILVTPDGVATVAALGTPGLALTLTVTVTSIASVALVPVITVDLGTLTITADSITSQAAVGVVTVALVASAFSHHLTITARLVIGPDATAQLSTPLGITAQLVGNCIITKAG